MSKINFDSEDTVAAFFSIILIIVALIFVGPWIYFWLSYFGGWIAKLVIGKYIVAGLKLIGITIPMNKIPLLAGTLGWIGGFFKTLSSSSKN